MRCAIDSDGRSVASARATGLINRELTPCARGGADPRSPARAS
jgi:hypothetical protein